MWALLDSRAPGARDGAKGASDEAETEPSAASASFSALAASEPLRGNDLCERLTHSERANELNVVHHPGNTASRRTTRITGGNGRELPREQL
eukprot:5770103-Pleurochrysis_carterae.AAC.1